MTMKRLELEYPCHKGDYPPEMIADMRSVSVSDFRYIVREADVMMLKLKYIDFDELVNVMVM